MSPGVSTDPLVDVMMGNLNAYAMNHSNFCAVTYGTQPMSLGALAAGKLFLVPEPDQTLVQSTQHPPKTHTVSPTRVLTSLGTRMIAGGAKSCLYPGSKFHSTTKKLCRRNCVAGQRHP